MKLSYTIYQQVKDSKYATEDFVSVKDDYYFVKNTSDNNLILGIENNVPNHENKSFVLCDGASESYDSKKWAKLLASTFCENSLVLFSQKVYQEQIKNILQQCSKYYIQDIDFSKLSWSQTESFGKGSFSTVLACTFIKNYAHILTIGDSTAFFITQNKNQKYKIESFAYKTFEDYNKRPLLVSTITKQNSFLEANTFKKEHLHKWKIKENSILLLMSDALAQWFLQYKKQDSLQEIMQIKTNEEFSHFVLKKRTEKQIKTDDTTLIKIIITE